MKSQVTTDNERRVCGWYWCALPCTLVLMEGYYERALTDRVQMGIYRHQMLSS